LDPPARAIPGSELDARFAPVCGRSRAFTQGNSGEYCRTKAEASPTGGRPAMSRRGPGLDTTVVLRLLTGEPVEQADKARRYFEEQVGKGSRPCVSDQVIIESYFALCYHYKVPKSEALRVLAAFVNGGEVICLGLCGDILERKDLGRSNPGFVDRLIHAQYVKAGASGMASFEKAAVKLPGVTLLA
jgi:predicted nucleic-acid-binding protein